MKKIASVFPIGVILSLLTALPAAAEGVTGDPASASVPLWVWIAGGIAVAVVVFLLILLIREKHGSSAGDQSDALTGIGNKKYMRQCYDRRMDMCQRKYCFAYIAFDAQRIEQRYGQHRSEELQKIAAKAISEAAEEYDYAARIENGAFVLCYCCVGIMEAGQKLNNLIDLLNRCEKKMFGDVPAAFRAGLYGLNAGKDGFETALVNARLGYIHAREDRVNFCVSTPELLRNAASRDRLRKKLSRAIDQKQFDLFLQFVYNVEKKRFTSAEVLSRWNDPVEGFLTPAHYIDDMLNTGVIDKFDFYMLDKSCRLLEEWAKNGHADLTLSCNMTRLTISAEDFIQRLRATVKKYDFPHDRLMLEITEDALVDNQALAYRNILATKNEGFKVAIDDFGAGHSSVSDLCDYPVDVIKVDRHIITKSTTERGDALINGIIHLAHHLGIRVVCEGVETDEQRDIVIRNGCDFIQGYLYSYVYPLEEGMEFYQQTISQKTE